MNPDDIRLVVALCRQRAGLAIDPARTYLIESRLAPLARRESYGSVGELIAGLRARREEPLIWALVEAMTSSETAFFRDRTPFHLFRDEILPTLSRMRGPEPIRIWSAGCSTGQEAYSLAMIAEAGQGVQPGARIEVYGSDLSERCLEKAQTGLYNQFEVQRGLPIRMLVDHFDKVEDSWRLSPRIRQRVRWRRINLAADLSGMGRFDVIFCRNVLMYFEPETKRAVLARLAGALNESGYLFLGASETAAEANAFFSQTTPDGIWQTRRRAQPQLRLA